MSNVLKTHPLAALFPELPPKELMQLARDIKERGQLEPIILHKGLILDGCNRYRACQMAGVTPQTEEFNPKATKRSPSEFVLSRNLRRRHLSVGQKSVIALEWSEQIELSPGPEKNKRRGRPKGALAEAAKNIGIMFDSRTPPNKGGVLGLYRVQNAVNDRQNMGRRKSRI
jgi:hypothetical protein